MAFAKRVQSLAPEGAYFVLEKAQKLEAQGRSIIHLEIGQPDFPTFENIADAGIQAIRDGHTRYTSTAGSRRLREVVAEDAGRRRGMRFDPAQFVVGPGAKPALFFPTLALVEPGDEVIYPDPGFPTYKAMIEVAGGVPVPVPLVEGQDFSFDLAAFDRLLSERTKLILLNSPSNPTGGVMPLSALEHIAAAAIERDLWVLSDEIYSRLVYGGSAPTIAALPRMLERTIICDGFSKTYAMTGWRLGYGIMPVALAERVALLQTHSVGSTADFTQVAGVEAVLGDQEQVEQMVAIYRKRRDVLVAGLNGIPGVSCRVPQGAFYVFPNVSSFGRTSDQIAEFLLEEAGVALLPGRSFGRYGEGYLRLCFANSLENIELALEKLTAGFARLR
jgi:aspartate/methionine/tyrosine aminotransferase